MNDRHDYGPDPVCEPDYGPHKRYREGTDKLGRGKLRKIIARRKKAGKNVKPLLRKLANRPKNTPAEIL